MIFSLPFGFQYLIGLSQVSSSFLRVDEASNTAETMQGGVFHSCTPTRCSNVVSRPKREPAQIRGVAEGSLNHLWCSTSRTSSPRWWKNKGLLGSLLTGKEGGLPPRRESQAAAPGEVAGRRSRTPAPPDAAPRLQAPGRAPPLPPRRPARRAFAPQMPAPSQPPPPLLLAHGSGGERNFLLRRPLRSPGVCGGEGRRGGHPRPAPPPARSRRRRS